MKRMRIFLIFSMIFILTGCIDSDLGDKNEDQANVNQNYLNYKQDVSCDWGKESAYYNGRIYYFQNEGEPGVYSMDTRGKDKQLEVSVSNIRKLQVRDDGIYFAAPIEDTYPKRYIIYQKKWEDKTAEKYFKTYPELTYGKKNVWDFYINENNVMFVVEVYSEIPAMNLTFQAFIVNEIKEEVPFLEYQNYLDRYVLKGKTEEVINVFGFDDFLVTSRVGLGWRKDGSKECWPDYYVLDQGESNMSVFNKNHNEIVFYRNYAVFNESSVNSLVQTVYKGQFIISIKNKLLYIIENKQEPVWQLELPEITDVRFSVRDGDDLIVIGDQEKKTEYIYRISLETAKIKESYPIEKGQKVLAVTDKMLYTVSKKALYVYSHRKKGYEQEACMKWDKKLKKTSKLEMCGNIIFVYDVDKKDAEFVLKEYQVLEKGLY